MATINLGNLTFTHRGDYAGGTAYVKNDVVYYATNGNSYIAKTSTTGNAPTSTAHWDLFVAGAGGIWNAGLSLGSANQVVAVNSGANALEFQNPASGKVKQVVVASNTSGTTSSTFDMTQSGSAYAVGNVGTAHISVSVTPQSSSSKFIMSASAPMGVAGNGQGYCGLFVDNVCRSVISGNGYSADGSGMCISGYYNNTNTNAKTVEFRTLGSYGGYECTLGTRRAAGSARATTADGQYGNMTILEVE